MKNLFFVLIMVFSFFSCNLYESQSSNFYLIEKNNIDGDGRFTGLILSPAGDTVKVFIPEKDYYYLSSGDSVYFYTNIMGEYCIKKPRKK